jgi:uncharacterized membrane protein
MAMANSRKEMEREDQEVLESLEHVRDIVIKGIPLIVALVFGVIIGLMLAGMIGRGLI